MAGGQLTSGGLLAVSHDTKLTGTGTTVSPLTIPSYAIVPGGWYNVTDPAYGAVGNGSTDDRVAIQAAIAACAAAGGGVVYFPPGTFRASRAGANSHCLEITGDNVRIMGAGRGKSVIEQPPLMPNAPVSIFLINNRRGVKITDITLDGNWGAAHTKVAISSHNVALPVATINVESPGTSIPTADFPASGTITIVTDQGVPTDVAYTGKTNTSFTGCTGGAGKISWGNAVGYLDPGHRTVILAASNGAVLPQATINVADTTDFAASGTVTISLNSGANVQIAYTGKTATTLTGCTGGTGTLNTDNVVTPGLISPGGNHVAQRDPKNHGVFARGVRDFVMTDVDVRDMYGDGVWLGTTVTGAPSQCVTLTNVSVDRSGRNGITFGAGLTRAALYGCNTSAIVTQDLDSEPQADFSTVRDITIDGCSFGGWWNRSNAARSANAIFSCIGAVTSNPHWSNYATNWRVTNNTFMGSCLFNACSDIVFSGNRVLCEFIGGSSSPVSVTSMAENVTIENNFVYDRTTPSGIASSGNRGSIQVFNTLATGHTPPRNIRVKGNTVHARNGHVGIYLECPGGLAYSSGVNAVYQPGITGTATAILDGVQGIVGSGGQLNRLQDSGAAWATNQWSGYYVRVGNAVASIAKNDATELQLGDPPGAGLSGSFTQKMCWTDLFGNPMPTPAAGAYTIFQPTGHAYIEDNTIECGNIDGAVAGGNGIRMLNDYAGSRITIRRNTIKNATGAAIYMQVATTAGKAFKHLEIVDNLAYDDQVTPTCTHVLEYSATMNLAADGRWIMRGNTKGDGVANYVTGLTTGRWLVADGIVQEWAGYGTPEANIAAPVGSKYRRLDGGTGTVDYVKETGAATSAGWVAIASAANAQLSFGDRAIGIWHVSPQGATMGTFGIRADVTGTGTVRNPATTSKFEVGSRIGYVSAAGAGSIAGLRAAQSLASRYGGFKMIVRFGVSDAALVATANMFVGLRSGTAAEGDVAPSTLTNMIGVGCDSGDTELQLYAADGTPRARTSLGVNFPVNTINTDVYEFHATCAEGGTAIDWIVKRLNTGHIASGTISAAANLPVSTTILTLKAQRSNGGTASAVGIDIFNGYVERPL